MEPTPNRNYVNVAQAQALVGVSRRTIYNWIREGKLTTIRTAGGAVRIDPASLFRGPNGEPLKS